MQATMITNNVVSFPVPIGHLYFFFEKLSLQVFCPFFNWVVCFGQGSFQVLCLQICSPSGSLKCKYLCALCCPRGLLSSYFFSFFFFLFSINDCHYSVFQLTNPFLCIIQSTVSSFQCIFHFSFVFLISGCSFIFSLFVKSL